jgi:hypothetical protein
MAVELTQPSTSFAPMSRVISATWWFWRKLVRPPVALVTDLYGPAAREAEKTQGSDILVLPSGWHNLVATKADHEQGDVVLLPLLRGLLQPA